MFQTKAEAEHYATESSQGGYPGAHEIELAGQRVWIPFIDDATYFHLIAWTRAIEQAPQDVLRKANDQGAFVFWNHPSFEVPRADLNEFHAEAVGSGLLQGVEVANGSRYYENAHRLALEKNLTLIGTSDIHELIDWSYKPEAGGHRPVTLVFAKVKTAEAVKTALFKRRTVVWWKDTLIGREPELSALLKASVSVESATYRGASNDMRVVLRNDSDAELLLSNQTDLKVNRHAGVIRLAANGTTTLYLSLVSRLDTIELRFEVMNALLAPREPATLRMSVKTSVE